MGFHADIMRLFHCNDNKINIQIILKQLRFKNFWKGCPSVRAGERGEVPSFIAKPRDAGIDDESNGRS
jgi:hypothetical protein